MAKCFDFNHSKRKDGVATFISPQHASFVEQGTNPTQRLVWNLFTLDG
jgi:hypothetical protein